MAVSSGCETRVDHKGTKTQEAGTRRRQESETRMQSRGEDAMNHRLTQTARQMARTPEARIPATETKRTMTRMKAEGWMKDECRAPAFLFQPFRASSLLLCDLVSLWLNSVSAFWPEWFGLWNVRVAYLGIASRCGLTVAGRGLQLPGSRPSMVRHWVVTAPVAPASAGLRSTGVRRWSTFGAFLLSSGYIGQ